MQSFFVFTLIPLFLSIGIIPAIPFSDATEYSQICIDKVWLENSKGKIACVTPSTADKLVERGWGTMLSLDTPEENDDVPLDEPQYFISDWVNDSALDIDALLKEHQK